MMSGHRRATGRILLPALLALAPVLPAGAFELGWPAACTDGTDCFVQNYVDHDGAGSDDFTCGPLTYPGHDGTDIRLPNLAAMRAGVAVLAPADGTVLRVRDGMPDRSIRSGSGTLETAIAALDGKDCGNGILIAHADGYETMLCHLRQGSVRVAPGDRVTAGTAIAQVGLSGRTEFPHVHMTLSRNGTKLDPYTGAPAGARCGGPVAAGLWDRPRAYRATALLGDGFADAVPDAGAMRDTPVDLARLPGGAGALVYWADLMGLRGGDRLSMRITAPDGSVLAETSGVIPSSKAHYFQYIGKRIRTPLPPGTYTSELTLTRDSGRGPEMITERTRHIQLD